jgi:hypothetical protein
MEVVSHAAAHGRNIERRWQVRCWAVFFFFFRGSERLQSLINNYLTDVRVELSTIRLRSA